MTKKEIDAYKKGIKPGLILYMEKKDPGKSENTYNTYASDSNYLLNNNCVAEYIEFVRSDKDIPEIRKLIEKILLAHRDKSKVTEKGIQYYYEKLCWQREYIHSVGGIDRLLNIKEDEGKFQQKIQVEFEKIADDIDKSNLVGLEKAVTVKARINQSCFRERLMKRYTHCCLCGITNPDFLVASHIKPWAAATSEERVDVNNGLLLCPHHDRAFDKGYISFNDDGKIMLSKDLSTADAMLMNLDDGKTITVTNENRQYFEYHRKEVFREFK